MEMELEFEERDILAPPHTQHRRGYYEKRSYGTSQTQSNWRKRYFELEGDLITYIKHEAGRTSFSRVSDTRERGHIILTAKTHLKCVDYVGSFTKRPYCIQIGKGDNALLIQTSSLQDQQDLYEAISSNIRRLGTNRRWIKYPRDTVYGMTLHEFLQYCFLYHGNSSERSEKCAPMQLAGRFKVDEKRFLFLKAVLLAFTKDWNGFKRCVISENSESDSNQIRSHRSRTPPVIGFGPFLDILELESDPPLSLLHTCQDMYEKFDAKKTAFNTFWSCRNRSEFSDESAITPLATRAE
uniref:Uncharacterized protein AlNc14C243G9507 n=1 Tax=Albugo laibachii Nc14 TaxID=890382 RepID=F0WT21_9STRA|nr:conserved hypothetical protein [Albugo laibachii Nc14]|eukprot:CCA24507.1 conserved hypothetical protein [Albugo laibachii Nc14]